MQNTFVTAGNHRRPWLRPSDWVESQTEQLAILWRPVKDKAISTCKDCLRLTQLDSRMTRATALLVCTHVMTDVWLPIKHICPRWRRRRWNKNEAGSRVECPGWVWVNEVIQYSSGGGGGAHVGQMASGCHLTHFIFGVFVFARTLGRRGGGREGRRDWCHKLLVIDAHFPLQQH